MLDLYPVIFILECYNTKLSFQIANSARRYIINFNLFRPLHAITAILFPLKLNFSRQSAAAVTKEVG